MYYQLIKRDFLLFIDKVYGKHTNVHTFLKNHGGVDMMVRGLCGEMEEVKRRNLDLTEDTIKEVAECYARKFCAAALNNKEAESMSKFSKITDFTDDPHVEHMKKEKIRKQKLKDDEWQQNLTRMDKRINSKRVAKGYEKKQDPNRIAQTADSLG